MLYVNREKCEGCEACVAACGTGAAQIVDGKCQIDVNVCVECYACKEVCPFEAIEEKE
ncbi:4Fe-4S binding protein [Thermovorax subterraneus]|nr:4Fe-4S binding protein [Thermovorax subterraneus]